MATSSASGLAVADTDTARRPPGGVCVLGIDASLTRSAFAALGDVAPYHEVILTHSGWPLPRRLRALADAAYRLAQPLQPTIVIIEEPGFIARHHGVHPITSLGRAQGAIMAGLPSGTRVECITVSAVRSAMGIKVPRGKGEAKLAVARYVRARGIAVPQWGSAHDDDVADAYLLALYGLLVARN